MKKAPAVHCLETTELEKNVYVLGPILEMDAGNSVLTSLDPNEVSTFHVQILVKKAPTVYCLETTELEKNMYGSGRLLQMDAGNSVLTPLDPNEVSTFHVRSIML